MAASASATTFNLTRTRLNPIHSSNNNNSCKQSWKPIQFPNINYYNKLKLSQQRLLPLGFFVSSSSQDETLVTEDETEVLSDESQPQLEDTEGSTTDDDSVEADGSEVEESPASILASLQSYKEAVADNDESKISEIETHLKSVEDEKLALERQLATLTEELSSAKDRVIRISADFDNFRKRTDRERISLVANTQGEVVESLLPVLDNFERAKAAIKVETEKEEKINNSYQSIYKQFVEILNALGVVPVETTGQRFDPSLHEAIMREESSEYVEGVIIEEFRKGFRIGERLLRPSMVKVSAGPGPESSEPMTISEPDSEKESSDEPEDVDPSDE
ncbi:uncharacterized protein [Rutidosis leptorrhynchoides]|uniref:uncharacterized protein n=1 Tax=Rutidosis leptorrhynchoides TaxID=125765 RepID=UPI003A9909C4